MPLRIGAPNTPMTTVSEQKRNYSQLDHRDWCRWWNAVNEQEGKPEKEIEFYWADIFPIRTPTVLRAALVEPNLVAPMCKSMMRLLFGHFSTCPARGANDLRPRLLGA